MVEIRNLNGRSAARIAPARRGRTKGAQSTARGRSLQNWGLWGLLSTALALLLTLSTSVDAAAPAWHHDGSDLVYKTRRYTLDIDANTGAPKSLAVGNRPIVTFGPTGWWRATFEDKTTIDASRITPTVTLSGQDIVCKYVSNKIAVQLRLTATANGIDLRAYVDPSTAVITRFELPASLRFDPSTIHEIDWPEELGRALKPSFFSPQPDAYVHWSTTAIGAAGSADVGIAPCRMLDYAGPPVPVSITDDGKAYLGDAADRVDGWQTNCARPPQLPFPERGTSDSGKRAGGEGILLNTPNGPLLSLETVDGGAGRFIRWSGVFTDQENYRVVRVSAAVIRKLWSTPPAAGQTRPAQIDLVDINHNAGRVAEWQRALDSLDCKIVDIRTPADALAALKAHDAWLMINLDGEDMPSTDGDEKSTAAAIHSYLAGGGDWLHLGGAPFYYTLDRQPYNALEGNYPPLFSDFMHVDSARGQVSVYGIQDKDAYFTPAHLTCTAAPTGGTLARGWITWIEPNAGWTSPVARIAVGDPVDASVRKYADANGFNRPLADKVKPALLAKWKQSLLINYSGLSFQAEANGVQHLPSPSIVHIWDYLHGGFDKQYPDHLPPNPNHGTEADFQSIFTAVHASGDLIMPYTNPTWWCDDPPGPTFVADGRAPLLVDRQGKNVQEVYGRNRGWALCTWHPEARAAEQRILDGFTKQYPVDILFQDQIGARSPEYDFNAAAPTPNTYTEGMIRIAERDGKVVPVGTENGFDAAMNAESEFCGVCWGLIPTNGTPDWAMLWRNRYAPNTWTFRPLALWLGHDHVLFAMHDLGQFVETRETLSWTLAAGYQLSAHITSEDFGRRPSDTWVDWISALQKEFGPDIDGAPLTSWQELRTGVFRAQYGSVTVTSNTTSTPAAVDPRTTLAPFGFTLVDAPRKLVAGSVLKCDGKSSPDGLDFITTSGKIQIYHPGRQP